MVTFMINGRYIPSPKGWETARVNAIFVERSQPDISVEDFTFEKEAIALIDDWVAKNGIFRGCPFTITVDGVILNFYLDFTKFTKVHKGKYVVGIKKEQNLNSLADRIEGYTLGLLASRRAEKGSPLPIAEIPYVVVRKYTNLEFTLMSISTYLLIKELNESIKQLKKDAAQVQAATAGLPYSYGAFLKATLDLVINLAYAIKMVLILKDLILDIINKIYPIKRNHRGFKIKDILEAFVLDVGFNGLEVGFDIDNLYYFPSKLEDERSSGIPAPSDYGYSMSEMFELVKLSFNADVAIDNNGVVQIRTDSDPYFERNSKYVMTDILSESITYNNAELKGTKIISFRTDITDEWTIDNYTGTSYEIHTKSITEQGEALIKGLDEIRINVALANRKDSFTLLEKALKEIAHLGDTVINALGGGSNFASKIKKRLGFIKVGDNSWNLPKVAKLNSNLGLDANHRELWSAKYLWENYHFSNSFVFGNQKRLFADQEIEVCPSDYEDLLKNSYFTSNDGVGKFTKLQKALNSSKAIGDYWIREVYDRNLKEEYIEP